MTPAVRHREQAERHCEQARKGFFIPYMGNLLGICARRGDEEAAAFQLPEKHRVGVPLEVLAARVVF